MGRYGFFVPRLSNETKFSELTVEILRNADEVLFNDFIFDSNLMNDLLAIAK